MEIKTGITYTSVTIKPIPATGKEYTAEFLVDTGATDCVVPACELEKLGIKPEGSMTYELADGRRIDFEFGFARIEVMDRITSGRVLFGADNADPILGVTVMESTAIRIDPVSHKVEKLSAALLK